MRLGTGAIVLLLCSCVATQSTRIDGPPAELASRTAGAPKRCVVLNRFESLRVSENDAHTLVYGSGRTIWANHVGECTFHHDDILVTEPIGSRLCTGDIVQSFDRYSRIPGPSCVLGDFVPYNR